MSDFQMAAEFREAPDVVQRQTQTLRVPVAALRLRLAAAPPSFVVTCARGSSAHAATFGKHLIERHLGIPVGAAAPNIRTIYRQSLRLRGQLFLTISQSGRSDDLVEMTLMAKAAGALTVAILNDAESPLAAAAEYVLPMAAGPELSIAATKSFVASLTALLQVVATWMGDENMRAALERLPDRLAAAADLDWTPALGVFRNAVSLATIGRGSTLAIAREAALKLKETCNIPAEAFSSAEFLHGPVALIGSHYPTFLFKPTDEAAAGMDELAADLRAKGARVLITEAGKPISGRLPVIQSDHSDTDAICLIQSFYALLVRLARMRGADADRPRHLRKVTRTR